MERIRASIKLQQQQKLGNVTAFKTCLFRKKEKINKKLGLDVKGDLKIIDTSPELERISSQIILGPFDDQPT